MRKLFIATVAAAALPLGACASTYDEDPYYAASTPPPAAQTTYAPAPVATAPNCGPSVGRSAAVGAGLGAAAGAGVSAVAGTGLLASAVVGAAVGGLAGAVWADSNNDGCVDGYIREGQYYSGSPVVQPTQTTYTAGERG